MDEFGKYVEFKQNHPYAENDEDFDRLPET
jgi:hypothetical protein